MLEALHAVNDRVGWISPGALNYIGRRLSVAPADVYSVATFYALSLNRSAAAADRARLHRHGLQGPGRQGAAPRSRSGSAGAGARLRLEAQPVSGRLRAGARGHGSRPATRWSST